jgi:hypothetical protein
MMRLFLTIATTAILTAAAVEAFAHDDVAGAARATRVTLASGDEVRVEGADIGCRVTSLSGHGKRRYVECRRGGSLAGTYGTYFGNDDVVVVRFLDKSTARVVLEARHDARAKQCRAGSSG